MDANRILEEIERRAFQRRGRGESPAQCKRSDGYAPVTKSGSTVPADDILDICRWCPYVPVMFRREGPMNSRNSNNS